MNTYRICLKVEEDGSAEQDMEIMKVIQAANDFEAVEKAILSVRTGSPSINAAKIWASSREWIRNSLVIDALQDAIPSTKETHPHV